MKIAYCSDLHLEFSSVRLTGGEDSDVLVLAGDICIAKHMEKATHPEYNKYLEFFQDVSARYSNTLMIMGNHEHYHGDFAKSYNRINAFFQTHNISNIKLMENEFVNLNGIEFIGSTLWTDFARDDLLLYQAQRMMNDYKGVKNTRHKSFKLLPMTVFATHMESRKYLFDSIKALGNKPCVVITHHAPSSLSVSEEFKAKPFNALYYSELTNHILDQPNIRAWIHGHMHDPVDQVIGDGTLLLANPRGYVGKGQIPEFAVKTFEINI